MKIILSHDSALEYWRAAPTGLLAQARPSQVQGLPDRLPGTSELADAMQGVGFNPTLPVHVIVPSQSRRRSTQLLRCHSHGGPLPKGSLMRIDDRIGVVSPELCLLQMASSLSLPQLIRTGCDLCGSYADVGEIRYGCQPVTSPAKIEAFVQRAEGMHGIKPLRRALPHILADSASPMETALALLLSLPCSLGGYGLPKPQMNRRVDVGRRQKDLASQSFYRCDLYWKGAGKDEGVAIEYDSEQFHAGPDKEAHDAQRRNELSALKVKPLTVKAETVYDWHKLDTTAKDTAKLLGWRMQPQCKDYLQRQLSLRRILLDEAERPPQKRMGDLAGTSTRKA